MYQLQRGFGGWRQHEWIQEFLSVLFSPQLILQLKRGSNGFIAEKLYLYFTKDPEAVHYFPGTWAMSSKWDNKYHSPASNHNCQALICQN